MSKKMKYSSLIVILIMLISKTIGFIRDIVITSNFGAGIEADAYNITYLMVITMFGLIGSAYSNSMMPTFSEIYINNKEYLEYTINNVLCISIILGLSFIVIVNIFPVFFVKILANNSNLETLDLAVTLIKSGIFSILFLICNSVLGTSLRIYGSPITSTISNILFPIPSLIGITIFKINISELVHMLVLGYMLQTIFQVIILKSKGYKFGIVFDLKDKYLKRIIKLMPNMMISSGVLQISEIFDNRIASSFGVGGITLLSLASKVNSIVYTIFSTSIMQVIYAELSKRFIEGKIEEFKKILKEQSQIIIIIIIPCSILLLTLSYEIITNLFMRGNFNRESAIITSQILNGYSIGLLFFVLRDIYVYIFYSMNNSKLPCNISMISVVINIVLNYILSNIIGISGIALATSISGLISFILLVLYAEKYLGKIRLITKREGIQYIVAGGIMFIIINTLKKFFITGFFTLIIAIVISMIIYFSILALLNLKLIKYKYIKKLKHY